VELELRLLQALEFYPPSKLKGGMLLLCAVGNTDWSGFLVVLE
jgi:hypothetical protein